MSTDWSERSLRLCAGAISHNARCPGIAQSTNCLCKDSAHNIRRKINVLKLLIKLLEYPTVTLLISKFKFCNKALEKHTPRLFIEPKK